MPLPSDVKVEVEFVSGTWTDVTADVDWNAGYTINLGRTSAGPGSKPQTSNAQVTLRSPTGKYMPGLQVLTDGTAAPYYPNVTPRRRLRISCNSSVRFLGYIKAWAPVADNGVLNRVQVQAADITDRLSRVPMDTPLRQEILHDGPVLYWPMTDPEGSNGALEESGGPGMYPDIGHVLTVAFGVDGPGSGEGTAVEIGSCEMAARGIATTFTALTVECWFQIPKSPRYEGYFFSLDNQFQLAIGMNNDGIIELYDWTGFTQTIGTDAFNDGAWHHLALTRTSATSAAKLYVDGALEFTSSAFTASGVSTAVWLGSDQTLDLQSTIRIGHAAVYSAVLSTDAITRHYQAGHGWLNETVDHRIARFLGYAGLTADDWDLDASAVECSSYLQSGVNILQGCQDATDTEGGDSVFYALAGLAIFRNRDYRTPALPALTLDAVSDLDASVWQPSVDDQSLLNQVIANRATASGTQSTQIVQDLASQEKDGLTSAQLTSYATDDLDVLHNAEAILAAGITPGFRLPAVQIDLVHAANDLYANLAGVAIGDRIRIENIPAGKAPAGKLEELVEGWTETANVNAYIWTADTSPADNPRRGAWSSDLPDDSQYGRWQCDGQTLASAVTATATTVSVATPSGKPAFTLDANAYGLEIRIDAEVMTVFPAPSSSSSPQTLTVARGANGTAAAAHASGAVVTLANATTWTL